ncbi:hypothetical protein HO173_001399 [Letharia columbiana]|uniref:Uncharacterized protein n=1 Tax=Letharia columbiana TaxID=112416 RepID=A0A8H6L9Q7_9LECA|nr:uncharacterized protein HO173_001399 [Letharia columbiana]KAF6240726.1 hypothetical protein HO173_001399 [Letharia columbiana]
MSKPILPKKFLDQLYNMNILAPDENPVKRFQKCKTYNGPKSTHGSNSRSNRHSTHTRPSPSSSFPSMPPAQMTNPVMQQFNDCIFNDSNGHSSRPSHQSSHHNLSIPHPSKSTRIHRPSDSSHTSSIPGTAHGAIEAYTKPRPSRSSKGKGVRFAPSASVREREPKHWHPGGEQRTNHESKVWREA